MATYVNDLRLKEIATGDESGTWGTSTNTNLELIGEALGYGTEAITTNADTHTTTVADGSTDPGRAMYIEYTGTLDSTCTITIAPNTLNRVHIIENGTSGSQSIIIKQGSGATVTIPTGATKMVYLDGAGSGAKVTDALASLNLETSKVIETTASIQTPLIEFTDGDDAITIADGGGTTFAQKITADAGIDIDNFNIDGTTLALSSGDFTLDVAGDIVFDAGGSDITLSDDGTEFGRLKQVSNGMRIQTTASDADLTIMGNDGGSEITVLTIDMSEAGNVLFHSNGSASNPSIRFNDASTGLFHPGSDALGFVASGTEHMRLQADGKLAVTEIRHMTAGNLEIGNDDEKIILNASSQNIQFQTGDVERLKIDSEGLKFNGDTNVANGLSDYEEGTFVANPTISGASGAIAFNTTNNHLSYTKIGNVCHVQGTLQVASNSVNGGRLNITNLPFTSQNGDGLGGQTIVQAQISAGTGTQASGYIASIGEGTTTVQIQTYTGVGTSNDSAITMAVDSFLLIGGSYLTT
jgi:hypothetical protein